MDLRTCTQCGTTMEPNSNTGRIIIYFIIGLILWPLWIYCLWLYSIRHRCTSCKSKLTLPADQPAARAARKRLGTELPKDLAKSAMIALLPLLIASSLGAAVDPDDDTVPSAPPATTLPAAGKPAPETGAQPAAADAGSPAQAPAFHQDPAQAASDAIHARQASQPAAKPAAPVTLAAFDPSCKNAACTALAHKFFAARHALDVEEKKERAALPPGTTIVNSKPLADLLKAEVAAEVDALNGWFSDASHIPEPSRDGITHQFWCECSEARSAVGAKAWPCWDCDKGTGKLQDMGCLTGKTYGPDWLDDLCNGAHKGSHRTN